MCNAQTLSLRVKMAVCCIAQIVLLDRTYKAPHEFLWTPTAYPRTGPLSDRDAGTAMPKL